MNPENYQTEIAGKNEHAIRFRIKENNSFLTFENVFQLWQDSEEFRSFYIAILENSEFDALYWEHPGLKTDYLQKPYEFIIQKSNSLNLRSVNSQAFNDYFQKDKLIVDFDNLGKNARLIVPTPQTDPESYKHLAKFIRSNQKKAKHELLVQIGRLMFNHLSDDKILWLNTAGDGVLWLHIRLDARPKYYKTQNYRRSDFLEKIN